MTDWTPEQKKAIEKENTNIIVSAGAGSGKTTVLTARVLRKLKEGVKINEMLILTFTRKAALEMKGRIREELLKDESLKDNLSLLDSSYITTFDSFSLSMVKKYNYDQKIGKGISIIEKSIKKLLLKEYLDEIFEDLYKENNPCFNKLINDLTFKDDDTLKGQILSINEKLYLKYDKKDYLNNYVSKYYSDSNIEFLFNEFVKLLKKKVNYIDILLKELANGVDTEYILKVEDVLDNLFNSNTYEEFKNNSIVRLPDLRGVTVEEGYGDLKKTIVEKITEIHKLTLLDEKELKESLVSTKEYAEAIVLIINRLDDKISSYMKEKGYYDYIDIAKMAISIVEHNKTIRDELKYSFKEIMIDEYQDTSDLQEEFIKHIKNNNVYMVGDIKQSIYRFRNANPYLFKTKYDDYSKEQDGIKIDLTNNFRSREEVVGNINTIFKELMTDSYGGCDYKKSHIMLFGNKDYENQGNNHIDNNLSIYNYEYDEESIYTEQEIEIFTIAKDIKEKVESKYPVYDKKLKKVRDITYNDFAILLQEKKNFDLYKKIFEYLDIPITKYSSTDLLDSDESLLINNILCLLISYIDNNYEVEFKHSLVSILRSYLFSYSDNDIFMLFKDNNFKENIAMDIVRDIAKDIKDKSLSDIINEIIYKFDFYNKIILVGDIEDKISRLDEIESLFNNLSNLSYDLYSAHLYLTDTIESKIGIEIEEEDNSLNSVKLMSIHASKGLEFPICYIASLTSSFNLKELRERIFYNNIYGMILPYYKEGIGKAFTKELFKDKYYQEEISEKIRLFYVALTRAKERIILITNFNKRISSIEDARCFMDMLSLVKDKLNDYIIPVNIEELNIDKGYNDIKEYNYKEEIKPSNENVIIKNYSFDDHIETSSKASKTIKKLITKEEKEKMSKGTLVHKMFEYLDFKNPNYDYIDKDFVESVKHFIEIINVEDAINIYKELEFTYKEEDNINNGVIDLLIEYKDHYDIIDYKLKGVEDDAYSKQLEAYRKYIESKTSKRVNTYLYSVIDKELKEIK